MKDKVVIITGAARGLGQKYCIEFAKAGAHIVAADIASCNETEKLVKNVGGECLNLELDVTDFDSCLNLASKTLKKFNKIDVLVNNAALYGTLKSSRFEDIESDQWDKAMNVNVKGVWNCCRAVVPSMRTQKSGSIINIASLAAIYGMPYAADYASSKAAVLGLTRVIAREVGKDGIRVNSVAPSMVRTDSAAEFLGEKADRAFDVIAKGQILQKTLEVDDIYGTILYLAGNQSKFVTGQTLMVDGGSVLL
jgi:NAD(P)-dependent dehydrogenase (short-subunit alcohol dehydrogenase family)|tara:strand:+ start:701 stop:1453 length:753 start_codon:yes stop_codon:yes gene_type:complete